MNKETNGGDVGKIPDLGGGKVMNLRAFVQPVHVAILCPPQAALTILLNEMGKRGGMFVMMMQIPFQVGNVVKGNGQANVQLFPMVIFAIQKEAFESWLNCKYDPVAMYQMEDVLNGKIINRG